MVTLVNNHVLFPHPADWRTRPEWSRRWENEITDAVTGAETRRALRSQPRVSLAFTITPRTIDERARLSDRVLAATKSGLACAPYHGRAASLDADGSGTEITVRAGRTWAVGDYIFLRASDDSYEVRQLTAVNLAAGIWTLEFADALTAEYPAGAFVWPLIFGAFDAGEMSARSPVVGPIRVTIRELVSLASAQLGAVAPPGGTGIGSMAIGSTFVVS